MASIEKKTNPTFVVTLNAQELSWLVDALMAYTTEHPSDDLYKRLFRALYESEEG